MAPRMHEDQIDVDAALVRDLLRAQHPQFAQLPISPVPSTGTDNALFRVGDSAVVRLPLRPSASRSIVRERAWLPVLASQLPLPVPLPLASGEPSGRFPWPWLVQPWLEGADAAAAAGDPLELARELAAFVSALHAISTAGGPVPPQDERARGVALSRRDQLTRQAIDASQHLVDAAPVTVAWEQSLGAPPWEGPPTWIHGDIASGNLLVRDGRLCAVIDWGSVGIGDPACDLIVAWELFDQRTRDVLRHELGVDDATWARGRGWALSTAIVALPYYVETNPFMAAQARRKIAAVLAEEGDR